MAADTRAQGIDDSTHALKETSLRKLNHDMESWPKSRAAEQNDFQLRRKKMKDQELHEERMRHDPDYRVRFLKKEKMLKDSGHRH